MKKNSVFVAGCGLHDAPATVQGSYVDIGGERFYRIANYDAMPPFFMSLVSDSDHWLFLSSLGGLTCGRSDPDHALFPYYTDDRIHDSQDQTGSKTILRVVAGGQTYLWEPFSLRYEGLYRVARNLYKSVYGNKVLFEEVNEDLGLVFSYAWMPSDRFGFVRHSVLSNRSAAEVTVELLDGIQNVLPFGVERRFQLEYSTLADGYKRTELVPESKLALFRLSSIPVDKAEPSEALRVNLAWSSGLASSKVLLSAEQFGRFRGGKDVTDETDVCGRRGAYILNAVLTLPADSQKEWYVVAEAAQDAAGVRRLLGILQQTADLATEIRQDVERGTRNLVRVVAGADGLQHTADELSSWRHFSNVLFNAMRGGIPEDNYCVSRQDFRSFLGSANRDVAARHAQFLDSLPETLIYSDLLSLAAGQNDVDLERLANEYLPLTFSRRHGDPSRPWNIFAIKIRDEHGNKILNYQGNWRDIFQNWEALALSYPGFVESMIFKFLDSSTADGYNPYRVMREGYEWEVIDPNDTWSFIGYWGDHQVIYLLKLLEVSGRYHPDKLSRLLTHPVFTFANVPYRIKSYASLLENPRATITFNQEVHRQAEERVAALGSDGKALAASDSRLLHSNLTEKLLVVILSKLSNYIPEAGIWMNTQRPEWNDANNALVGSGVSMVTLYYLRRFLSFAHGLLQETGVTAIPVAEEIAEMFVSVATALDGFAPLLDRPISNKDRKAVLDALGMAGEAYRNQVYERGFSGKQMNLPPDRLAAFCRLALRHIDHSIRANRRSDGLYHAYNLMKLSGEGIEIRHLYEMLEGQVAVLSSGILTAEEAAELLDALRKSSMYRDDQRSYMLYPNRELPHFLEKNNIPSAAVEGSKLLSELLRNGDSRIVIRDSQGDVHFHASFRNANLLKDALESLRSSQFAGLVEQEERKILDLYEKVFDHQSFTGRSGTFYKYEGLGSIYWHMVSKLLLAVGETLEAAVRAGADEDTLRRLQAHYHEIREGIGVHKSPAEYGAVPTDPYSHTPSFAGVQQPGMTGQVKEDILSRFSEMGASVEQGRLRFLPALLRREEVLPSSSVFHFWDIEEKSSELDVPPRSLAFTICQVPVLVHLDGPARVVLTLADGTTRTVESLALGVTDSAAIFGRSGAIQRLDVYYGWDS